VLQQEVANDNKNFIKAKSSILDEIALIKNDNQKTTAIKRNEEDLPNQNHQDSSNFRR
jgi:hypothetical protein